MKFRSLKDCLSAAAFALSACSGASTQLSTPPVVPASTLGGTINAAAFTIPAGQTKTVTSNLTVVTTGSIEIDGTLAVAPGVRIMLFAGGPLTINGVGFVSTQSSTSVKHRALGSAGRHALDTPPAAAVVHVFSGASIAWNGPSASGAQVAFNPGDSVSLATNTSSGTVSISVDLALPAGADGTSTGAAPGTAGGAQAGGSIDIGTATAIANAMAAGHTAAAPASISISGSVSAGDGGWGESDVFGTLTASGLTMLGGNGAAGGSVNLAAAGKAPFVFGPHASLRGGNGGNGGSNGFAPSSDTTFLDGPNAKGLDGVAPAAAGVSLAARTGDGGNGGNVAITPGTIAVNPYAGAGGAPGSLDVVRAGNGGPGGNGGATVVIVGNSGANGTSGFGVSPGDTATIDLDLGGSGGDAPTGAYAGGNGGAVTITSPKNGEPDAEITMSGYAFGGEGFNGCSVTPQTAGTSGGNGGRLTVKSAPYMALALAFDGGDGGSGTTAGAAGIAGRDDAGAVVGVDGRAGTICGQSGPGTPPGPVVLMPVMLQFTQTGASASQPVTAAEANFAGPFNVSSNNCPGIASISPASGTTFTVTPVSAGMCTFLFAGAGVQTAQLVVHIATTTIGGQ